MIKLIKLVSGVEVMGEVLLETKKSITLENPIQINYRNIDGPMPAVSVTRYLQFASERQSEFDMKYVLNVVGVIQGMEKFYHYSLNNFKVSVDKLVDRELAKVVYDSTDLVLTDENRNEAYTALLEDFTTDHPSN
jgi:hypothetical protein